MCTSFLLAPTRLPIDTKLRARWSRESKWKNIPLFFAQILLRFERYDTNFSSVPSNVVHASRIFPLLKITKIKRIFARARRDLVANCSNLLAVFVYSYLSSVEFGNCPFRLLNSRPSVDTLVERSREDCKFIHTEAPDIGYQSYRVWADPRGSH